MPATIVPGDRAPLHPLVVYAPDPEAGTRVGEYAQCACCGWLYQMQSPWDTALAERWEPLCRVCVTAYFPVLVSFAARWLDVRRRISAVVGRSIERATDLQRQMERQAPCSR